MKVKAVASVVRACALIGGLTVFYYMAETAVTGAWWVIARKRGER